MIIFVSMRTLDALETDKIESWLDRVELFLMELQATDRAQLILDLNQQIQAQLMVSHELRVDDVLKKMGEPIQVANRVRSERGFKPRSKKAPAKRFSVGSFLIFSFLAVLLLITTCTISLPFVVPWGLNHLANKLGDQPPGVHSFQFFKNFGGTSSQSIDDDDKHDPNDLNAESAPPAAEDEEELQVPQPPPAAKETATTAQESINGNFDSEGMTAIHIQAKNAKLMISSSTADGINYDCKISSLGYARPFIRKSPSGVVTIALDQIADSAECELKVPVSLNLEIQMQSGEIGLTQMSQGISVEANEAEIHFSAAKDIGYDIEANLKKGEVKGREAFDKQQKAQKPNKKYKAKFLVNSGNISLQP